MLVRLPESKPAVQIEACSSTGWSLLGQQVHLKRFWTKSIHQRDSYCLHGHASHQYSFLISHFCLNESRKYSNVTDQRFLSMDHYSSEIGRHFIYTGKSCWHVLTLCNTTFSAEYLTSAVLGQFSVITKHAMYDRRIYVSRPYLPFQNLHFQEYGFLAQNWVQFGSRKTHTLWEYCNLTIRWIWINYSFIHDYYYMYTRKVKQIFHSQTEGVMTKGRSRSRSVILNIFRCRQSSAFQIVLSHPLKKKTVLLLVQCVV